MTFLELAKERYSERYFDSKPVEDEKLKLILEAGRLAPTGCNYQPQRIYVIKSEEAKEKAISTKASLSGCPLVLLVCYDSDEVWRNPREEGYNCGEQDASSVALHMMFEATELGVHSLWIRGFNSDEVRKAFNLPENHVPAMMVALGYPSADSHPAKLHSDKKPLEDTVIYI